MCLKSQVRSAVIRVAFSINDPFLLLGVPHAQSYTKIVVVVIFKHTYAGSFHTFTLKKCLE